jgi:hypothetical protein
MDEICQNCGGSKSTHPNIDKYLTYVIDSNVYDLILKELGMHQTLYGNVCLNYKRDNLRFLESLASE